MIKLTTSSDAFSAAQEDLISAATDICCSYQDVLEAGQVTDELIQVIDNIQFCRDTIRDNGVKWYFDNCDRTGNLCDAIGVAAESLTVKHVEASMEGLISELWEKVVAFIEKVIKWFKDLFTSGSSTEKAKTLKSNATTVVNKNAAVDMSKVTVPVAPVILLGYDPDKGINFKSIKVSLAGTGLGNKVMKLAAIKKLVDVVKGPGSEETLKALGEIKSWWDQSNTSINNADALSGAESAYATISSKIKASSDTVGKKLDAIEPDTIKMSHDSITLVGLGIKSGNEVKQYTDYALELSLACDALKSKASNVEKTLNSMKNSLNWAKNSSGNDEAAKAKYIKMVQKAVMDTTEILGGCQAWQSATSKIVDFGERILSAYEAAANKKVA